MLNEIVLSDGLLIIDFYTYDCYNEVVFLLQALVHGPPQSMPISP